MDTTEIEGNLRYALKDETRRERQKTLFAASLGLPVGLALTLGLPLISLPNVGASLVEIFAATIVAPPLVAALQRRARNKGWLISAEFLGYFGAGLGSLGALLNLPGTKLSLTFLEDQYESEGRYSLAQRIHRLANSKLKDNGETLTHIQLAEQTELLQLLYNGGQYEQCMRLGEKLLLASSRTYYDDSSDVNQIALWNVQSLLVVLFNAAGQGEKSKAIWSNLKSMREFSEAADKAQIAYAYKGMTRAGIAVEDYWTALRYAKLAHDCYERAELSCKLLSGEIALDLAHCHLKLGQVQEAEMEIANALQEWKVVLSPYAARMSEAYYLFGLLEKQNGELEKAAWQFNRAASVLRQRTGKRSLQMLPILVALRECLTSLEREPAAHTVGRDLAEICESFNCKPTACATLTHAARTAIMTDECKD